MKHTQRHVLNVLFFTIELLFIYNFLVCLQTYSLLREYLLMLIDTLLSLRIYFQFSESTIILTFILLNLPVFLIASNSVATFSPCLAPEFRYFPVDIVFHFFVGWHKKNGHRTCGFGPGLPGDGLGIPATGWKGFKPAPYHSKGKFLLYFCASDNKTGSHI